MTVTTRFRHLYQELASLNVEDLAHVYHDDVVFQDPVATHSGLSAVQEYFRNLLQTTESCQFHIHDLLDVENSNSNINHVVIWRMTLATSSLNKGKPIQLDGTSMLKVQDDKVIFHRDYYDLGQMVYEHVPILGFCLKKIKNRMSPA